jgi:hypothetical protein
MLGILHTTENDPGDDVNSYFLNGNLGKAPNVLLDPSTRGVWHYYPVGVGSKALWNEKGGVETNNRPGGVYQVEIVARAADVGGYSDEWYDVLQGMLVQLSVIAGIEYRFYESTHRFSFEEWNADLAPIWYGHCNVPENDHWDPGTLDYSRLKLVTPPTEAPDMELTDTTTKGWTVNDVLNWAIEGINKINARLDAALAPQPVATPGLRNVSDADLLAEVARRFSE